MPTPASASSTGRKVAARLPLNARATSWERVGLFSDYFLTEGIGLTAEWQALDDARLAQFRAAIAPLLEDFEGRASPCVDPVPYVLFDDRFYCPVGPNEICETTDDLPIFVDAGSALALHMQALSSVFLKEFHGRFARSGLLVLPPNTLTNDFASRLSM